MEELEIADNAFNLIFAFDEIVALGYRESVNLAQIRTFVEMDSHEEKVYQAVRLTQEREAKNKMREKAKELQRQRMEATKKGGIKGPGFGSSSGSGGYGFTPSPSVGDSANFVPEPVKPAYTAPQWVFSLAVFVSLSNSDSHVNSLLQKANNCRSARYEAFRKVTRRRLIRGPTKRRGRECYNRASRRPRRKNDARLSSNNQHRAVGL